MLRKNSNITMSLLTDATVLNAALPSVGTVVTPANLPKGAVVFTDLGLKRISTVLSAMAVGTQFLIVQGCGVTKPLLKSPILTAGNVSMSFKKHIAAVQQVSAIGFNGTTGSLPAANDTSFFIKIRKNDNDTANQSQPMSLFAQYKTDATGTQEELALGLAKNGNKNFADEPANGYVKFEVINDEAGAVPTGTTTLFTPVVGSKVVTIDGTLTNVAVGDSIRLEGAGVSNAIYVVTAYTASTSIVLDRPFTGVAAAYAIANVRRITAAASAAAEYGIIITGIAAPFDVDAFRNYYVNRFTASFSEENTPITHLVGAVSGNGVWQQVALDEYMTYGFEGQNEMLAVPPRGRDQLVKIPGVGAETAATSRYSVVNLAWTEGLATLVTSHAAKGSVICHINLTSAGIVGTAANTSETLATQLGITPADLDA
jgi:hypothetical protein